MIISTPVDTSVTGRIRPGKTMNAIYIVIIMFTTDCRINNSLDCRHMFIASTLIFETKAFLGDSWY